jgi:hypothetical protein
MTHPEGQYTNVKVNSIQHGSGSLTGGTGTLSAIDVFSAGMFPAADRPVIGEFYNISGDHNGTRYDFPGRRCTHSGGTSDFQEP